MKVAVTVLALCLLASMALAEEHEELEVQEGEPGVDGVARKLLDSKVKYCDPWDGKRTCSKYEYCGKLRWPKCKKEKKCDDGDCIDYKTYCSEYEPKKCKDYKKKCVDYATKKVCVWHKPYCKEYYKGYGRRCKHYGKKCVKYETRKYCSETEDVCVKYYPRKCKDYNKKCIKYDEKKCYYKWVCYKHACFRKRQYG